MAAATARRARRMSDSFSIKMAIMRVRWTDDADDAFEVYALPQKPQEDVPEDAHVYARGQCVEGKVVWQPDSDLSAHELRQLADKIEAYRRTQPAQQ